MMCEWFEIVKFLFNRVWIDLLVCLEAMGKVRRYRRCKAAFPESYLTVMQERSTYVMWGI